MSVERATSGTGEPALGGAKAWAVWGLAVAFVVYYFGMQTGYSIVNPSVQKDHGLTVSQIGVLAATYTWVYAACQFFSGALLDRLGARVVLLPAIALVTLGAFVFANAHGFEMLLLSQFILAVGACAGFVGAGYVGGQWFGMAKFSFMFGLVQFAASISSAFSQNLISLALGHWQWQALFNLAGVLGIALFALGVLFIHNPKPMTGSSGRGMGAFIGSVVGDILRVAKIGHVWQAALIGSLLFGAMLAMGVVWAPKLLIVRGLDPAVANVAASFIWIGLAAGCLVAPRWSDKVKRRKMPILVGILIQLLAFLGLVYAPDSGTAGMMALCAAFGFGNAAHMLTFSTAADVVAPTQIGTVSALVNGLMFLVGGIMISRPGLRVEAAVAAGIERGLEFAQYAAWPLTAGLILALVMGLFMKETYPTGSR